MVSFAMTDLKLAARRLLRKPGFALVAILTIALGIAANTVIVAVAKGILHRATVINEPERVVWIQGIRPEGGPERRLSFTDMEDFRKTQSFEEIALFGTSGGGVWEPQPGQLVPLTGIMPSAGLMKALGISPVLGRMFEPSDKDAILISHELWQEKLGGRMDVIGSRMNFGEETKTILGVIPKGLEFPWGRIPYGGTGAAARAGVQDMWTQLPVDPPKDEERAQRHFHAIARLKPGVSIESARNEVKTISARLAETFPVTNKGFTFDLVSLRDHTFGATQNGIYILGLAALAVWLIGCVNLANLLLAQGLSRARELSVRVAIGARRIDLLKSVFTESFLLAMAGGVAGILLALWIVELTRRFGPAGVPFLNEIRLNSMAVFSGFGLAALTAFVFGLAPAIRQSRAQPMDALRGAHATAGSQTRGWQNGLIVGQVALSLTLLLAAALLLESFRRVTGLDLGYKPDQVVAMDLYASRSATNEMDTVRARRLKEHLAALPGVQAVGTIQSTPLTGRWTFLERTRVDGIETPETEQLTMGLNMIAFDYFQAMGVTLVAGRFFRDDEMSDRDYPPITILNESAAARLFPGQSALGKRIFYQHNDKKSYEVVGIVKDARDLRIEDKGQPAGYILMAFPDAQFVVRGTGDLAGMAGMLRREVGRFDWRIVVNDVRPMRAIVSGLLAERRFVAILLGSFATIALAIASLGVFGVMAYQVAQRHREFGVRLALGALPRDVKRLVLGWGGRITVLGIGLGIPLALAAGAALRSQLFEISHLDPSVYCAALTLMLASAFWASWLPARRASKVNPMDALRCE